jgi:hypothetical protein
MFLPPPPPQAYIYAPPPQIQYSAPPWMFYNGVSNGYMIGSFLQGGPSVGGTLFQAGRALMQPSQACAMWIDAQGHLHC